MQEEKLWQTSAIDHLRHELLPLFCRVAASAEIASPASMQVADAVAKNDRPNMLLANY